MDDIVERYRKRRADRISAKLDGGKGSGKPKGYGGMKAEEAKKTETVTEAPAEEKKTKGKKKSSTTTEQASSNNKGGSTEATKSTTGKKKKSSTSTTSSNTSSSSGSSSSSSSPHGTLVETFGNGVKQYEKPNHTMSKEEAKEWFTAYDNVIKKSFVEKMGIKSANMEYDRETGRVTAWVDNLPIELSNGKMGKVNGKVFFQTGFKATKNTYEKPDGSIKRTSFSNIEPTFEFIGSKY